MKTIILALLLVIPLWIVSASYNKDKLKGDKMHNTLTVIIEKPIEEVFEFTTNPNNTPAWLESVEIEKTNENPTREGTIYQNRGKNGPWSYYKVSKYIPNKEFELIKQDQSTYHVNYSYSICPDGQTKLIYHEWVETGAIEGPFTQYELNKLKEVMEYKPGLSSGKK